jgi:hypothetical protein
VNAEIKVGENSFYKSARNLTHDGNSLVSINLLCVFVQKTIIADIAVVIVLCLKIHQSGEVMQAN